ncbi:MAG: ABC transporter permease [Bryobacteraceae bacterium]
MTWSRIKYLLPWMRRQSERDMREELRALAALAEPGELGNLTLAAENARENWGWTWLSTLLADIRYGTRSFLRQPGFLAATVLTLALGIGANTTIFSLINATILKPLPFPDSERLVVVWKTYGKGPNNENIIAAPDFWDFRSQTHSFEAIAIFDSSGRGYNLSSTGAEPEQVSGLRVSATFFTVLRAKPKLGRTFLAEEEQPGKDHEVVLSYGLWKRRYGGKASIVGQTIRIDGESFTVVGVMPQQFQWQFWSGPRELWVPVGYTKTDYGRGSNSFLSIARLKPSVTLGQARSDLAAVGNRIAKEFPVDDAGVSATADLLNDYGVEGLRQTLVTLLAAVGLVLLIACVNVANLMLARGASRQKEIAIRRALGAPAWRIARQLLTESVLLSIVGGVAGVLLAGWSSRLLFHLLGGQMQLPMRPVDSVPLDGRVLAFALLLSCLTGVIFGLAPALSALRTGVNEPLKEGGRESTEGQGGRLRHALVAAEVALALVVLSAAGLVIKSTARLLGVDPGLDPKNVLTMVLSVPQQAIYTGPPGLLRFCRDLTEYVGAIPGVVSVGAVGHLPFEGNAGRDFQIEGRPPADPEHMPGANYSVACPGYFRSIGIPVQGREFTDQDTLASPGVIVINQAMARQFWPKQNAIGKAIRFGGSDGPLLTVVGIAGDVHYQGLDAPVASQFMRPYTQAGWPIMNIVVRTRSAPEAFTAPVKNALKAFLPDRPVAGVETMANVVRNSTGSRQVPMVLLSVFSGVALLLAAVGITGVVSYSTMQRRQEIGIRMALGARGTEVVAMVVRGSMKWVLAGLTAGILGSIGTARVLGNLLYEVRPTDPSVLGAVLAVLTGVAVVASFIPAFRAAHLDPMHVLHRE